MLRNILDLYIQFLREVFPFAVFILKINVSEIDTLAVHLHFPILLVTGRNRFDRADILNAVALVVARGTVMADLFLVLKESCGLFRLYFRDVCGLVGICGYGE